MKKFAIFVVIALIIAMVTSCNKTEIEGYSIYVVQSGDTLWEIAQTSNGNGNMDIRDIIEDIKTASNCKSEINVGDILKIPNYKEDN